MHRIHSGFTVAIPVKNNQSKSLRTALQGLNNSFHPSMSFFKNSPTTLFVSGAILPAQNYNGTILPEVFVFATTYSGPLKAHLKDLMRISKRELGSFFVHCIGFPDDGFISDTEFITYLRSHSHKGAFNSRYHGLTKEIVEKEKELRNEIEEYIDNAQRLNAFDGRSASQVKTLIQRHITTMGDRYKWANKHETLTPYEILIIKRGPLSTLVGSLLLSRFIWRRPQRIIPVTAFSASIALFLLAILFYISADKTITARRLMDVEVRKLTATQLHPVLNEMVAAAPLKKGRLRRFFYALSLRVAHFFADYLMKIPTVSNIRWLSIDNKRRLVFLSTYTNTTDFYVRDFLVGKTPLGVNFMFTNGEGFPDAKLLAFGGIRKDPEGYMNAVHKGQQPTDFWYAHEPDLTSDIINKNRKVRNGLFKNMNEQQNNEWLRLL